MAIPVITPDTVRSYYPAISADGWPDATVQIWIGRADPFFDACRWDGYYEQGVSSWVAHQLVLFVPALTASAKQVAQQATILSSAGDMSQKKVGDVSVGRDGSMLNKQADNPFYRTIYGQEFLWLRSQVDIGAIAV